MEMRDGDALTSHTVSPFMNFYFHLHVYYANGWQGLSIVFRFFVPQPYIRKVSKKFFSATWFFFLRKDFNGSDSLLLLWDKLLRMLRRHITKYPYYPIAQQPKYSMYICNVRLFVC